MELEAKAEAELQVIHERVMLMLIADMVCMKGMFSLVAYTCCERGVRQTGGGGAHCGAFFTWPSDTMPEAPAAGAQLPPAPRGVPRGVKQSVS